MKQFITLAILCFALSVGAQSTSTAKIYVKGNYFIIEQNDKEYSGARKNVEVYQLTPNSEFYYYRNILNWTNDGLKVINIVDESNTPYTAESWETFYTENTGNFKNGGGAGEGVQTPTEIAEAIYVDEAAALAGGLTSKQYYHTGDYIIRIIQ